MSLSRPFNRINEILSRLVAEVQNDLARIWPILGLMNRYLGNTETAIINFSMSKARDNAWSVAERLSPLTESEQKNKIMKLDAEVTAFARVIRHPGIIGSGVSKFIQLGERGSIPKKIDILE